MDGDSMARKLGVSRRTLYRDLQALREAGVPCRQIRGKGFVSGELPNNTR